MSCEYCRPKTANDNYKENLHALKDALRALEAAIDLVDINGINKYTSQINKYHDVVSKLKPFDWHDDLSSYSLR